MLSNLCDQPLMSACESAEELIRSKYAISYDEFLKFGKIRFPEDIFRRAVAEVELIRLDVELVIVGFPLGFAMLIRSGPQCSASIKEDFATAGEGSYLASASLLKRNHISTMSLARTLYNVYEAKRFAEGVPSVGRATNIAVLTPEGLEMVTPKGFEALETAYAKYGPTPIGEGGPMEMDPAFLLSLPVAAGGEVTGKQSA